MPNKCIKSDTSRHEVANMQQWDAQVVIVGAGPVGLSAALRLEAFGISAIVLEAETELPEDLRASTFHPPTLDMLAQYGLAEPLIAQRSEERRVGKGCRCEVGTKQ